jgi:uncharacterized protein YdaU (DUF1376 family)
MGARPWYKRFPSDFITGTISLTLEEAGAYSYVIDLIHDRGGAIPDDPQWIARVCGCSTRKWKTIRERLIQAGKITQNDGFISSERAQNDAENGAKEARKFAESGAKGGRKLPEKKAPPSENKDLDKNRLKQSRGQRLDSKKNIKKKNIPKVKKVDLDDMKIWARERGLTVSVAGEYEKYLDWGIAHGKRHKDERAGFRNWLRAAQKFSGDGTITPKTADQVKYDEVAAKLAKGRIIQAEISQAKERAEKYGFDLDDDLARISKEHGEPLDQLRSRAGGE